MFVTLVLLGCETLAPPADAPATAPIPGARPRMVVPPADTERLVLQQKQPFPVMEVLELPSHTTLAAVNTLSRSQVTRQEREVDCPPIVEYPDEAAEPYLELAWHGVHWEGIASTKVVLTQVDFTHPARPRLRYNGIWLDSTTSIEDIHQLGAPGAALPEHLGQMKEIVFARYPPDASVSHTWTFHFQDGRLVKLQYWEDIC